MKNSRKSETNIVTSIVASTGILSIKAGLGIVESIIEVGKISEEIFRGDRLPVLQVNQEKSDAQG